MIRMFLMMSLLALAGCGLKQPFGKAQSDAPAITAPPWEALVAAGPGAANDIDLETLNGPTAPNPSPESELAVAEGPDEEPAVETPPPKATGNKLEIKAVAVLPVTGAPGQGNKDLTTAMRQTLTAAGWTVLPKPAPDALTIQGSVALSPPAGATQTVALKWNVAMPNGKSLGDINQANDVPAGSLDSGWGENAGFAAEAAATGIFELINKFR
jgi:hypothetical protein